MSKMKEVKEVKVVDVVGNTEFSYNTDVEPKKGTLGNSYFGTLSAKGIAKLQSVGFNVNNETDWCNLLRATFKLNEEELGTRGEVWDNPEQRARYKVYIDNVEFNPAFTKGQIKKYQATQLVKEQAENNIKVPEIVAPVTASADITPITPQVIVPTPQPIQAVMPTPQVVAQPIAGSNQHIETLKKYIAEGKYSKEILIKSLAKKVGEQQAKALYLLAVTPQTDVPDF